MDSLALSWLPCAPETFKADLRTLRDSPTWHPEAVLRLATSRLNLTQLHSLAKLAEHPALKTPTPGMSVLPTPIKLTVLSNASTELLVPALTATAFRHELLLDVQGAPFGLFAQEALDPCSATRMRCNDFVLLALDHRAFGLQATPGEEAVAQSAVDAALQWLGQLVQGLRSQHAATVVLLQTIAPPAEALFGNLDAQVPGTQRWLIERLNSRMRTLQLTGTLLLDLAAIASNVGLERWHDPTSWAVGKFAFAHAVVPLFAENVCRLIDAARGKAKKCLVLDLDNTLWGGVIGDDGLAGIVLGQGTPAGEAYLSLQAAALALRARGVVLAVSSKNDETVARQVFREHPEMLLREEHIAVFQANWNDKAANLRAIAEILNIGVDALVFMDDNPAERQQVRLALPRVAVPELPQSPEHYAAMLLAGGYFESVQFTAEDRTRATQYQANAARAVALGATTDLGDYLKSLEMEAFFHSFDSVGRARITQLVNKTNQFNLTTRRYSEADIEAFETDPSIFSLQVRLKDRFGDNGMISVVLCRPESTHDWLIDTWLMSCRVLNRNLERQTLNILVAAAKTRGVTRLIGHYRPTEKNGMVKEHYATLGFEKLSDDFGESRWRLNIAGYAASELPIKVMVDDKLNLAVRPNASPQSERAKNAL